MYICVCVHEHTKTTSIPDIKSMTVFKPLDGRFEGTFIIYLFCATFQVYLIFWVHGISSTNRFVNGCLSWRLQKKKKKKLGWINKKFPRHKGTESLFQICASISLWGMEVHQPEMHISSQRTLEVVPTETNAHTGTQEGLGFRRGLRSCYEKQLKKNGVLSLGKTKGWYDRLTWEGNQPVWPL